MAGRNGCPLANCWGGCRPGFDEWTEDEHPTFNIQHRTPNAANGRADFNWMLGVARWMLDVFLAPMSSPTRISYVIIAVLLVLIGWLHLGVLVLTVLFGYFALRLFSFGRSKLLGVALYIIMVAAIGTGLVYFSRQAYVALPEIAKTTIPAVVGFAEEKGVE